MVPVGLAVVLCVLIDALPEVVAALAATRLLPLVPVNLLGVTLGGVAAVTVYLGYGLARPEAVLLAAVAYSHRLGAAGRALRAGGGPPAAGADAGPAGSSSGAR